MVSVITHAATAVAFGAMLPRQRVPASAWLVGALAAAAPDLDYLLYVQGVAYGSAFGHRGASHSLAMAAALGALLAFAWTACRGRGERRWLFGYFAGCMASHGLFDAMTDGGLGIAFLWPLSTARCFLPWRPIEVAPLGIRSFFTQAGWQVMQRELLWVWLPLSVSTAAVLAARWARRTRS